MNQFIHLTVRIPEHLDGLRLDQALAELVPDFRPPNASLSMKELVRTLDTRRFVFLKSFTAEVRRTLHLAGP